MPNGDEFNKKLAEWEKQSKLYFEQYQTSQKKIDSLNKEYTEAVVPKTEEQYTAMTGWQKFRYLVNPLEAGEVLAIPRQEASAAYYKKYLPIYKQEQDKAEFYYRVYNELPYVISAGQITSPEDALSKLPQTTLSSLSDAERNDLRVIISDMITTLTGIPEMARDIEEVELPELVPPTEVLPSKVEVTLQRLTVEAIIKALQSTAFPRPPSPILSDEEWKEYLTAGGYDPGDPEADYIKSTADQFVLGWQEVDNQNRAFREGIAEMPDYSVLDLLKSAVVTPGLALADTANFYFEHVTQPLAGWLYIRTGWFGTSDDAKKYEEYKKTESAWMALGHAWREWDAPGEGAVEWVLKYMIMEGIVDPLSYVGWGLATKITKPLGGFGRVVGSAEKGFMQVMDIPFDMIKAGLRKLPKSLSQRAALQQAKSIQYVEKWVGKFTGKSIKDLTTSPDGMVKFSNATEKAIRAAQLFPNVDTDVVRAGKVLLEHTPVNERIVMNWSNRLTEVAQRPGFLTSKNVTKELVENVNNLFEDYFWRGGPGKQKITNSEAASRLLGIFGIDNTDDAFKLATRLLDERANQIVKNALAVNMAKSPIKALYGLGRRNFRYYTTAEESMAALARKQIGAFSLTMQNMELRAVQVWRNGIDKWVVRPFAEAYLAFALYGPMNIVEDVIRSSLGGVWPNRFNATRFGRKWVGIGYDPQLMRDAMSETLGELRRGSEAAQTNWILSLGGLAKGFGEKAYGIMVEKPGQVGIAFRRGSVDGRATQIMKEKGGDLFERLVKIDAAHPRLPDKKLTKLVVETVNDLKLSANPESIKYAKDLFTQTSIMRKEVNNTLMEHPDLPRVTRDRLLKDFDDGILMTNPDVINARITELKEELLDDFIRSPERASEQMKQLADFLTDLEIKNPQEMAQVMYSLNYMAQVQGAVPKQVMKRVTQRTRGLPFEERFASISADMDRLVLFLEKSKDDMQRIAGKIKADIPGVSPELTTTYDRYYDTLVAKSLNASDLRMEDIARRRAYFEGATKEQLRDVDFWEQFYRETDAFWERFDASQLDFDDLLQSIAKEQSQIMGVTYPTRPPVRIVDRPVSMQDIAAILQCRTDDISKELMGAMALRQDKNRFIRYVMRHTTPDDVGFTPESIGAAYDQMIYSLQADPRTLDWMTPRLMEIDAIKKDLHNLFNSKLLPDSEVAEIGRYIDDIARQVEDTVYTKPPGIRAPQLKPEWKDYNTLRQSAMDEAHKWYYKEFTDYTNANVFDAIMKTIYPYWTYESQRLFWLPRSFLRHPGTFTTFERWQNNSDYGYIRIPGTPIEWNPFRGTVYGTLTTRLTRRDFPEYYDQLGVLGNFVEFNDFLSRYGFYPGAHIGIPLAVFGGVEMQFGEVTPALPKTGLDVMMALFPDNEQVRWITDHVFGDRFRDYLTILQVNRRGGDGTLIFSKAQEGKELTEEEQQLWDDARREVGWYSAGFEQFGMFRMRTEEQTKMYEQAGLVIQEMTGYTPDQQEWLRKHGYRLWDMVGGMSPTQQATLQELDYYKWIGNVRPLLPGKQQAILNQIELAWNDVEKYSERSLQERLTLQSDFLTGRVGSQAYSDGISAIYSKQREYIDNKIAENPLMDLDNRADYYKKYNIPQPVLHPMRELLNLYFSIELEEKVDEETGEKVPDWDKFWSMREAIEQAIPDEYKQEWEDYLSRNSTALEQLRREHNKYIKPYNALWERILKEYTPTEQGLIKEYYYLVKTGTGLDRRVIIEGTVRVSTGRQLISNFRSDLSEARQALRYANPYLDAVLFYWGRVTTFQTPQAEEMYRQLARQTGKML